MFSISGKGQGEEALLREVKKKGGCQIYAYLEGKTADVHKERDRDINVLTSL